jgi:glycerol uptake facilitator-like aquaporin
LSNPVATWRRLLAEFVGTALLVTAVVGSGIMAATLSPNDKPEVRHTAAFMDDR